MTPEERAQLAAAQSVDELEALLQAFLEAGTITDEESDALWDEFYPPLKEKAQGVVGADGETVAQVVGGGQGATSFPELSQAKNEADLVLRINRLVASGQIPESYAVTLFDFYKPRIGQTAGDALPPEGSVAPVDQLLSYPGIKAYLGAYISDKDLADRISNLLGQGIIPDEETAGALYNRILGIKVDPISLDPAGEQAALDQQAGALIRAGTARAETAQTKAAATSAGLAYQRAIQQVEDLNLIEQAKYRTAKTAETEALNAPIIQANKDVYLPGLKTYLQQSVENGAITQEQADSQYATESAYIGRGFNLTDLPNYANLKGLGWVRTPEQRLSGEAKAEVDFINQRERAQEANRLLARQEMFEQSEKAGLDQLIDEYRRRNAFQAREAESPALPRAEDVAEEFLSTIGAPRFREFIRSKLGGIAAQTAGAREEWWRKKQPVQPMAEPTTAVPTFESLLSGARADVRERGDILRQAQQTGFQLPYATEQVGLSETRLADLLALGQEGYFAQQRALAPGRQEPWAAPKPTTEEDPFLTEIKKKYGDKLGFMAEWLSLAPETRGYQKSRFAPRVQFRF